MISGLGEEIVFTETDVLKYAVGIYLVFWLLGLKNRIEAQSGKEGISQSPGPRFVVRLLSPVRLFATLDYSMPGFQLGILKIYLVCHPN